MISNHLSVFSKTLRLYEEYENNFSDLPPFLIDETEEAKNLQFEIEQTFEEEYSHSVDKQYFYGCSIDIYKKTFEIRFKEFKKEYFDSEIIDFIRSELDFGISWFPLQFVDGITRKKIRYSLGKRFEFLKLKASEYGFDLIHSPQEHNVDNYYLSKLDFMGNKNNSNLKWKGSQTELIELTKALIENGNLKGTQKEIIQTISDFFGVEMKNPDKLLTDIKKRNIGSETLFLDKLKSSLYNYLTEEKRR